MRNYLEPRYFKLRIYTEQGLKRLDNYTGYSLFVMFDDNLNDGLGYLTRKAFRRCSVAHLPFR